MENNESPLLRTHPRLAPGVADDPVFDPVLEAPSRHRHDVVDERFLLVLGVDASAVCVQLVCGHNPTTEEHENISGHFLFLLKDTYELEQEQKLGYKNKTGRHW